MSHDHSDRSARYDKNSLSLWGAGIFALTGQVAELAREWFPMAFLVAAIVAGFSACSFLRQDVQYLAIGGRLEPDRLPGKRITYVQTNTDIVFTYGECNLYS